MSHQTTALVIIFLLSLLPVSSARAESAAHIERANRLHMRLTRGIPLNPTAPYFSSAVEEMREGNALGAAQVITDAKKGAPDFYNGLIGSIPKSFNRDSAVGQDFDEQAAFFIGATRDDRKISTYLTDSYTYFDPNLNPTYAQDNPGHYRTLWQSRSAVEVLKRLPRPGFEGVGIFTSYRWMENYAQAGTNRRHVYGVLQNLFCTTLDSMKTKGVPDMWVLKDIPRKQKDPSGNETSLVYESNCALCHAGVIDAVFPRAFGRYDFVNNRIELGSPVFQKLNEVNSPFRSIDNDTAYIWVTADQQRVLGLNGRPGKPMERYGATDLLYTETNGLREFAELLGDSDGFHRCMVKRLVAAIYLMKDYTVTGWTPEEYALLDAQEPRIQEFASKLRQSGSLKAIAEEIAVFYTP